MGLAEISETFDDPDHVGRCQGRLLCDLGSHLLGSDCTIIISLSTVNSFSLTRANVQIDFSSIKRLCHNVKILIVNTLLFLSMSLTDTKVRKSKTSLSDAFGFIPVVSFKAFPK
ncbi:hypothetical protein M095_0704 [Parabacteroides distasonis str. 3999B T(B) 4]|nr:hypothetical protein M095_0704 [Parabacteroides distasonis str. 3999B T(B) 4]